MAAVKSMFSIIKTAMRSKTFPFTLLVGDRGRLVANSEATAAVSVAVLGIVVLEDAAAANEARPRTAAVWKNILILCLS
jgi:hypothetical protein